jgi:AraC-like DNA-binding protein
MPETAPADSTALRMTRSIPALRAALEERAESPDGNVRTADGWHQPLRSTRGFRHLYDAEIARGGWEFYELQPGLWLLTVDMEARRALPRRHHFGDNLVLSAVLEGDVELNDPRGDPSGLSNGYCTLYGMREGGFESVYQPGRTLKWVSVIIDRACIGEVTSLRTEEMPEPVARFYRGGHTLPARKVPLAGAASLVVTQILDCRLEGGFRRAFLRAKTLELACLVLQSIESSPQEPGPSLTERDRRNVARARELLESSLDSPPNVPALASSVGMTRQKLQAGFRQVYGGTVAQIRDKLRIERALELVRHSRVPMTCIALETGYEYLGSFTRAFRAAYGTSPTQMRRMAEREMAAATTRRRGES